MKAFRLVVVVTCGFLLQGELCSHLSPHDGVRPTVCGFKGEGSIGNKTFTRVHREAKEGLWEGAGALATVIDIHMEAVPFVG